MNVALRNQMEEAIEKVSTLCAVAQLASGQRETAQEVCVGHISDQLGELYFTLDGLWDRVVAGAA